jgi:hypothetical protein
MVRRSNRHNNSRNSSNNHNHEGDDAPPVEGGEEVGGRPEDDFSGINGNVTVHLPDRLYEEMGLTQEIVEGYPALQKYDDVLLYCAATSVGTQLGVSTFVRLTAQPEDYIHGGVAKFLVLNQIRPTFFDVGGDGVLVMGVLETIKRLGQGDFHAVNRRAKLESQGVFEDFVSEPVRAVWI